MLGGTKLSDQKLNLNLGKPILVVWVGFVHCREDQLLNYAN